MKKLSRQILIEAQWLILSLGLTILLTMFLLDWTFPPETIDIHLHETMFVISRWYILTPLFLLIAFIVYVIKESRKSFRQALPNCILITIGLTLVILFSFFFQTFSQPFIGGWTSYPPLSALDQESQMSQNAVTKIITNSLIVIQIIIIFILLVVTYRWGKTGEKLSRNH